MKDRWIINKFGLVNFWYYDDEEFNLSDGKLLLRGANGSGKSVTMQSFIPLLLDGNKRPERIDPFGTNARRIENYLLMDEDENERTAYLYMELKKKDSERYLTLGIGLKAVKGKSVDSWYFIITDGRRIKKDLFLYIDKGYEKIPLTKRELINRIEGNFFTESQIEYKKKVNEHLFGYDDMENYDELMDLLINIRSPKLSKDFKPTTIYGILENSLRQLNEDDLRPMSEAMENMDNIKLRIEQLEQCQKALNLLENPFRNYNNYILFEKAKKYFDKYNETLRLDREKNDLYSSKALEESKMEEYQKELIMLKDELYVAEKKIEEFLKSDIKDIREKLETVNRELNDSSLEKENKINELDLKKDSLRKKEQKKKEIEDEIEEIKEDIKLILDEMESFAKESSFLNHEIFKDDFNITFAKEAILRHRDKIRKAKDILGTYEFKKNEFEEILQKKDREEKDLEYAKSKLNEAEEYLTTVKEEHIENIVKWNRGNKEIILEDENLHSLSKSIMQIKGYSDLINIKSAAVDKYNQNKGIISANIESSNVKINEYKDKIKEIENKIIELKNIKDIEFERDEEVIKNRERLKNLSIPFVPLYKAIDFKEKISDEIRKNIECALLDMGLLDALIIPKKYKKDVLSLDNLGCDKYLFPEPILLSHNLSEYLKVDTSDLENISFEDVDYAIQSILLDNNSITYIDEKGNYGIGILKGKTKENYILRYIGQSSRKKYRESLIEELKNKILEIELDIKKENEKISHYKERIKIIEEEFKNFPSFEDIEKAIDIINESYNDLLAKEKELNVTIKKFEETDAQIREFKKQVYNLTEGLEIEKSYKAYSSAQDAAEDYISSLTKFETFINKNINKKELLRNIEESIEELSCDIDIIIGDINKKNEFIKIRENLKKVYEDYLEKHGYESIKDEIEKSYRIKEKHPEKIRNLSDEKIRTEDKIVNLKDKISEKEKEYEKQYNLLKVLEEIFLEEVNLGYVEGINKEKKPCVLCKDIINNLQGDTKKSKEDYDNALYESYTKNIGILRDYQPKVVTILKRENADDEYKELYEFAQRKDIRFRVDGKETDFNFLKERLNGDLEVNKLLLSDKEKEFFQDILLKTVSKKVSAKIHHSRNWVNKMNEIMQSMNTSSTFKLTLKWVPKRAENEMQLDTKKIIDILEKEVADERDIENLSKHFSSRVKEIIRNSEDLGESKNYHTVIKEILDYRKWYEFKLYSSKEGEKEKELTNNAFYQLSGGEKAMAMYIPLFTAIYSRYDMAKMDCPRIVALDEAFAGVDEENIRDMFRILKEMELDYILNSQVLWGTYDTVENLAIANIERPDNSDNVLVIRYLWNGRQLQYEA
ncbi:TIGR02680 family protein [Caloramator quimbayensis]|uniref:TIGR02680 family protein n=1 Tax=Caloramator quimbayensis TaxID=1147123 RepID=A0A1T4YB24_9CLOT|nr:TIGR02680 family protein [Caloramator quimbayensis]SKA98890.1 TIGR02680 family protein [Caloramator quimbayensis]